MVIEPPILRAIPEFGTPAATRWAILNLVNDQVWTGTKFSTDWDRAMLYAQPNPACIDMQKIMLNVYKDEPRVVYETPVEIEVFGDSVTMKQVEEFLRRTSLLGMRTGDYGNGPNGSLVTPSIYWDRMKKRGTK